MIFVINDCLIDQYSEVSPPHNLLASSSLPFFAREIPWEGILSEKNRAQTLIAEYRL